MCNGQIDAKNLLEIMIGEIIDNDRINSRYDTGKNSRQSLRVLIQQQKTPSTEDLYRLWEDDYHTVDDSEDW
jgi:hypothetical protein